MSTREVCFILVDDKLLRIYFGSATKIPDSRDRWKVIWQHRHEITEIAHSHPGEFLDFSEEDLTTMQAVEAGTGKALVWSLVTAQGFLSRRDGQQAHREDSPWWLALMRTLSYGRAEVRRGNITWQGQSGNYLVNIDPGVDDNTIRNICEEAVRSGEVPGVSPNIPRHAFANFVIDRFQSEQPRFVVRPKVPFGA
jgi:hypothetical protein